MEQCREIRFEQIAQTVAQLCVQANTLLPREMETLLCEACAQEPYPPARETLELIRHNAGVAREHSMPICQDTGMAVVFAELGQDAHIVGGLLEDAVNEGVRRGYTDGYLRKSVVRDPIRRGNTGDNTPAVIASTASPYKFPDSVLDAFDCEKPADPFAEAELLAKLSNTKIPAPITALRTKPVRFENTCAAADMADFVRETVRV